MSSASSSTTSWLNPTAARSCPGSPTSWTVSPDHLTYTFHLKPGVKFTDGTPVDAQAIVDNLNYQVNPKTGRDGVVSSYIVPAFKSATAVNDLTVQVKLKEPYAPFLGALAEPYAGIISPKTLAAGTTAVCDNPVGSGPFIFTKWNHGQNIEFVSQPELQLVARERAAQGPGVCKQAGLELHPQPDDALRVADER